MQNERKAIAPFLYYTIVSSLTSLVFIVVGLFVFTLLSYRITNAFAITVILVLLLWKDVIVAGFMTWSFHKYSDNKDFAVKYIGLYLGHFYGIFIGGFLGARIANLLGLADIIGFMIGALALYFIGRWIGSRVSITIGDQVDKVVSLKEYQLKDKVRLM
jgi:predicted MFS family arabinose efflux permease